MQMSGKLDIHDTPTEVHAAFFKWLVLYGMMFGTLGALGLLAIIYA